MMLGGCRHSLNYERYYERSSSWLLPARYSALAVAASLARAFGERENARSQRISSSSSSRIIEARASCSLADNVFNLAIARSSNSVMATTLLQLKWHPIHYPLFQAIGRTNGRLIIIINNYGKPTYMFSTSFFMHLNTSLYLANAGIPLFSQSVFYQIILLIPIIAIEAYIHKKLLNLRVLK